MQLQLNLEGFMPEDTKELRIADSFTFDSEAIEPAKIKVIGVGGGGGNAVNNMISKGIRGIDFLAINTDAQALEANLAPGKIQIGRKLTQGLGAGARPSVGAKAADESREAIEQAIAGSDMVFITAGMGGGTGTGAAPVVAAVAHQMEILTVAIVTKPFHCEGSRRLQTAMSGIQQLAEHVDTLIVVPNERLLDISKEDTTLIQAFEMADEVLYSATRGISDLITVHGLINLDFADVRTTMEGGGTALMGSATATGPNRAEKAAVEAISSPLLDGLSINGARNILVNITAGSNLGIREATTATDIINREADGKAEVIFGTVIDESLGDSLRVTVIATGFEDALQQYRPSSATVAAPPKPLRYKGEESLKELDAPAFQRRGPVPPVTDQEMQDTPAFMRRASDGLTVRKMTVRDLDGQEVIEEEAEDDESTPAFLRKMMD
ncbi:MAG: cell division protein FtsZ [Rhodothermales bacterium]